MVDYKYNRTQRDWLVEPYKEKFKEHGERKMLFLLEYIRTKSWVQALKRCEMPLEEYRRYCKDEHFMDAMDAVREYITEDMEWTAQCASGAWGMLMRKQRSYANVSDIMHMVTDRRRNEFFRRRENARRERELGKTGSVPHEESGEALPEITEE